MTKTIHHVDVGRRSIRLAQRQNGTFVVTLASSNIIAYQLSLNYEDAANCYIATRREMLETAGQVA